MNADYEVDTSTRTLILKLKADDDVDELLLGALNGCEVKFAYDEEASALVGQFTVIGSY